MSTTPRGALPVRPKRLALEPRILFDGAAAVAATDSHPSDPAKPRGRLKIEGERRSWLGSFGNWLAGVYLKESGF